VNVNRDKRALIVTPAGMIHLAYDYGVAAEDAEKLDRTTIVEFLDSAGPGRS
jgi:hypothetical protein